MLIDMTAKFESKIVANQSQLPYTEMEKAIKEHSPEMQLKILAAWSNKPKASTK